MNAPCRYGELPAASSPDALGRGRHVATRTTRYLYAPNLPGLDGAELVLQRALRRGLQVDVERGVHLEALLVEPLAELLLELLADPLDEVRRDVARFGATRELERIRLRETRVGVADGALLAHQLDDGVAPLDGALGQRDADCSAPAPWAARRASPPRRR